MRCAAHPPTLAVRWREGNVHSEVKTTLPLPAPASAPAQLPLPPAVLGAVHKRLALRLATAKEQASRGKEQRGRGEER